MKDKIQNDLSQKFSKGTIAIHWLTAFLILALFPLGKYMAGLEPSEKMGLIKIHIILGIIVFILTIIRSWLFFKKSRAVSSTVSLALRKSSTVRCDSISGLMP